MRPSIRPAVPADAEALTSLVNRLDEAEFATVAGFRRNLEGGRPAGTERLVAEAGGRIVGFASCRSTSDGGGTAWVGVEPAERRRGLGRRLHERLEAVHRARGVSRVRASTSDPDGAAFAAGVGYRLLGEMRLQALALGAAELPPEPAGVLSLREAGPWSIRALYADAMADVPTQPPLPPVTDEEFRRAVAESPSVDLDASVVAVEGDDPVAFTIVVVSREAGRAGVQMTGVRADRRGRGLAFAVKAASLHRARTLGVETVLTANDLGNAPMLAVNRKLGFEPTVVVGRYEKTL